jgi:hypothetical protein
LALITDSAAYRYIQKDKPPASNSSKAEMKVWLLEGNIPLLVVTSIVTCTKDEGKVVLVLFN